MTGPAEVPTITTHHSRAHEALARALALLKGVQCYTRSQVVRSLTARASWARLDLESGRTFPKPTPPGWLVSMVCARGLPRRRSTP